MKVFGLSSIGPYIVRRSYDPNRGDEALVRVTGEHDVVRGYEASFRAQRIRYTVDYSNPIAVLEATLDVSLDGRQTPDVDRIDVESTWEIDTLDKQLSVWEHPAVRSYLASLDYQTQSDYRAAINALVSRTQVDDWTWSNVDNILNALIAIPDLSELLKRLVSEDNVIESQSYVIRNTERWPANSVFKPDYTNTNKQVSSATLARLEPTIPFTIPPNRYWLTRGPRITQLNDGRLEQVREWWETPQDTWKYEQII